MLGQGHADLRADAIDHVEDAIGQTGLGVDLGQLQCGQRGDFAGLEDHGVAGSQGRSGFPQGDLDRVVPGADASNHAQRLAAGVDEGGLAQRDLLAFQGRHETRVVLEHVGTGDDVDGLGLGQGLAGVEGFQQRQLVVALAEDVHGLAQDARALHGGHRGPNLLAGGGGGHRLVHVGAAGALHHSQHLAGGGVQGFEGGATGGGDITATDVQLLFGETGHGRSPNLGGRRGTRKEHRGRERKVSLRQR